MSEEVKYGELAEFLSQFSVVRCDYDYYCERDGVLYSSEQVADFANAVGIPVSSEFVAQVLTRWGWSAVPPYEWADLRFRVVGEFPLMGKYNGQWGLYYITKDGMVFIPVSGEPIAFGWDGSHGYYRFANAGRGRWLDFTGTEEDFLAYWAAATRPLEWDVRVSAAVMLPVLLGLESGGWFFVGGDQAAEISMFAFLILLVWGRLPDRLSLVAPWEFFSKPHRQYIEETGLVGLICPPDTSPDVFYDVEGAIGVPPLTRHRVVMVCAGSHNIPSNAARRLLRVPLKPGVFPSFVGVVEKRRKALMGAFRLYQRAAKTGGRGHPILAVTGWTKKWGFWMLRFAEALGVGEEVRSILLDYLSQWAADVRHLYAIRKVFASRLFVPCKRYTLADLGKLGRLSEAEINEFERATLTHDAVNVFDWVTTALGYRLTKYPKTATRPVRLSFRPLKGASQSSRAKQKKKPQRTKARRQSPTR